MSATGTPIKVGYFGKIPARGDFIKATDNAALITLLDNWLAQPESWREKAAGLASLAVPAAAAKVADLVEKTLG